jgi:opacity protein-like surface antigen
MRSLLLAAAFSAVATAASAQSLGDLGRYVSFSAGTSGEGEFSFDYANAMARSDVSLDSGASYQLAFGTRSNTWRLEAALSQRTHDAVSITSAQPGGAAFQTDRGDVEIRAIDLNGFFDLPTGTIVRPYIGAGIGLAQIDLSPIVDDESQSTLQLQAIGGVSADISPRVALFAEARFQRVGDVAVHTELTIFNPPPQPPQTFEGDDEFSFSTTQLAAGIRFSF